MPAGDGFTMWNCRPVLATNAPFCAGAAAAAGAESASRSLEDSADTMMRDDMARAMDARLPLALDPAPAPAPEPLFLSGASSSSEASNNVGASPMPSTAASSMTSDSSPPPPPPPPPLAACVVLGASQSSHDAFSGAFTNVHMPHAQDCGKEGRGEHTDL